MSVQPLQFANPPRFVRTYTFPRVRPCARVMGRVSTSRTAEYVALYRALETNERRREPLFRDRLAPRFLTGSRAAWLALSHVPGMRAMIERYGDTRAPGARTSTIARTRYIDDFVRKEIKRGIRQLVLLGAGF